MRRKLLVFAIAVLTIGLLGSCRKINERIDDIDKRVDSIEQEKIASIQNQIAGINQSIADLGTIRNDILNLQVAVGAKGEDISALQAADVALGKRIDELKTYVGDLSKYAEKDWATATFATLEQLNATNEAINALEELVSELGETSEASDARIAELDEKLSKSIKSAVSRLNSSISFLEGRVSDLEQMIQSVTIVPAYSDGSVEAKDSILCLDVIVEPAVAVKGLTKENLKVLVNEAKVKTKAVDVGTVTVTKFKVDAAKGTITARADISSVLPEASGKALTIAVNVKNGISDYTTEFYPVTLSSNVTVKDETDTTKVTIKADEDFPGPVIGNIVVAEGFKNSKPTTIDVQGIGTVTFDMTATNKIRANAEQAGATSVFFKVEDVTTTKPVENADVVLEVTMKTVDENGIEVFSKGKEAGEVTIEIPMDENVAYVNSVALVNDAGESIPGGVVPGSEKIENGKLIFKVNHFSKYAVDYVTKDQFVSVTGVNFFIDGLGLLVGDEDNLSNFVTITPDNATNKKVTWSSSNPAVATVDKDGKVTAVSAGTATITVTTADGSKTATCPVTVGVPVTGVSLNVNTLSLNAGGSHTLIATITPEDATNKNVTWSSSNESVATVDSNGKVTAVAVGTANIIVKTNDGQKTASCIVNVEYKPYVEIAAKYDGQTTTTLKWYRQNLSITDSGQKAWKGDSGSAVKVPGMDEDVVVGDYFQWAAYAGYCGSATDADKGLLLYTAFTNKGCGDGTDGFTFKTNITKFEDETAPYGSGNLEYRKYNNQNDTTLVNNDDVASIVLGDGWRMPTATEFKAMKDATYWNWDAQAKGYYVYVPSPATDAGKVNNGTGQYNTSDALLFFPAAGFGGSDTLSSAQALGGYWSSSLGDGKTNQNGTTVSFNSSAVNIYRNSLRDRGFSIRPVKD